MILKMVKISYWVNLKNLNKLRIKSEETFLKSIKEIEGKYENILNTVLKSEEKKYDEWERWSKNTIKSLEFEKEVHLILSDSLYSTRGKVINTEILKSSAEFAYLSSLVNKRKHGEIEIRLRKAFHVNFTDTTFNQQLLGPRMFVKLTLPELKEFLLSKNLPKFNSNIVDEKFRGEILMEDGNWVIVALKGEKKAVATANPVLHFWSKNETNKLVIEFVMVVTCLNSSDITILNEMNEDERIIDVISDTHNLPAESIAMIKNLEREIFEKFADHERRVWGELEPNSLSKHKNHQDELSKLHGSLQTLKLKIEEERGTQEKILVDMREALIGVGGPKLY